MSFVVKSQLTHIIVWHIIGNYDCLAIADVHVSRLDLHKHWQGAVKLHLLSNAAVFLSALLSNCQSFVTDNVPFTEDLLQVCSAIDCVGDKAVYVQTHSPFGIIKNLLNSITPQA